MIRTVHVLEEGRQKTWCGIPRTPFFSRPHVVFYPSVLTPIHRGWPYTDDGPEAAQKLSRRAWYGGRKGRRALRRLHAAGTVFVADHAAPDFAVHVAEGVIDPPPWWSE